MLPNNIIVQVIHSECHPDFTTPRKRDVQPFAKRLFRRRLSEGRVSDVQLFLLKTIRFSNLTHTGRRIITDRVKYVFRHSHINARMERESVLSVYHFTGIAQVHTRVNQVKLPLGIEVDEVLEMEPPSPTLLLCEVRYTK